MSLNVFGSSFSQFCNSAMTMEIEKTDGEIRFELLTWNLEMQRLMFKALRAKHLTEEEGNLLLSAYVDIHLTDMLSCGVIYSSDKQLDKESQVKRYKTNFENQLFEIVNNKVSNLTVKYHFDDTFSKQHHQNKYPKTISSSLDEDSDTIFKNPTKKRKLGEEDSGNGKLEFPDLEVIHLIRKYLLSSEYRTHMIPIRENTYEDDESDDKSDDEYDDEYDEEFDFDARYMKC